MPDDLDRLPRAVTAEEFSHLYRELRQLAHARMSRERDGHTLQTTALVHEAFVRLADEAGPALSDPKLFFPSAALAMRRVLIEHARAKGRKKRGGGLKRINLDVLQWVEHDDPDQILTLDEAICRLEQEEPEDAQLVRLRFYAGLDMQGVADIMGVSLSTVERRWRFVRAWLWRELRSLGPPDRGE